MQAVGGHSVLLDVGQGVQHLRDGDQGLRPGGAQDLLAAPVDEGDAEQAHL